MSRPVPPQSFDTPEVHMHPLIPSSRLPELLRAMPKAELHIHIEGSLEPELIFAMSQHNAVALNYPTVEALREAYIFDDLQSFLDIYHAGTAVLRTEQDFYEMTSAYLARARADNVLLPRFSSTPRPIPATARARKR